MMDPVSFANFRPLITRPQLDQEIPHWQLRDANQQLSLASTGVIAARSVLVASGTQLKLDSVRKGLNLNGLPPFRPAPSGVNEQPLGLHETRLGAMQRLAVLQHEADKLAHTHELRYLAAIENGILATMLEGIERILDVAVVLVHELATQRTVSVLSGAVEFPRICLENAQRRGLNVTNWGAELAMLTGIDLHKDPHNYLTVGRFPRVELLAEAVRLVYRELSEST